MRIEIVSYRNPDGNTSVEVFVDGQRAEFEWTEADPGATHRPVEDWRDTRDTAIAAASPAAATEIHRVFDLGENTEYVIHPADLGTAPDLRLV